MPLLLPTCLPACIACRYRHIGTQRIPQVQGPPCCPPLPLIARLGAGEIEIGLGIHGEPGYCKAPLQPAQPLVQRMLQQMVGARASGDGCVCDTVFAWTRACVRPRARH